MASLKRNQNFWKKFILNRTFWPNIWAFFRGDSLSRSHFFTHGLTHSQKYKFSSYQSKYYHTLTFTYHDIAGELDLDGKLDLNAQLDLDGQLDLDCQLDLDSQLDLDGQLQLDVQLDLDGQLDLDDQLDLDGQLNLDGQLDLVGKLDLDGQQDLDGQLDLDCQFTLSVPYPMTLSLILAAWSSFPKECSVAGGPFEERRYCFSKCKFLCKKNFDQRHLLSIN